jgi:hypothetical protein
MESKGKSRTGTREGRMRGARRGALGSAAGCGLSGFFTLVRLFRQVFPAGLARSRCWLDGRGSHAVEGKGGGLILGQDGRTDGRTDGRSIGLERQHVVSRACLGISEMVCRDGGGFSLQFSRRESIHYAHGEFALQFSRGGQPGTDGHRFS